MKRTIHSLKLLRTNQLIVIREIKAISNINQIFLRNVWKYLRDLEALSITENLPNLIHFLVGTTTLVRKGWNNPKDEGFVDIRNCALRGWDPFEERDIFGDKFSELGTFKLRSLGNILRITLRRHIGIRKVWRC